MKVLYLATLGVVISTSPLAAQQVPISIPAQMPGAADQNFLPANTQIVVRTNDELNSKTAREGDTFGTTVVHDVLMNGYVIIPRGSRAVGEVTWKTGKGAFGKSGKMEIEMRYVEVAGQRVPIEGKFRQEGEGNTVATVAGVVAVGVFAGFVTGKTAVIPRGRELMVHTVEPIPISLPTAPQLMATAPIIAASASLPVRPAGAQQTIPRLHGESCVDYARRLAGNRGELAAILEEKCKSEG